MKQRHPYHLVDFSLWPLMGSASSFLVAISLVLWFHQKIGGLLLLFFSIYLVLYTMYYWWMDVVYEAFDGHHTKKVQKGLRMGMALFIISEVMFFFSFFWAFFTVSLSNGIEIGDVWPPVYITPMDSFKIPLLNTLLLLTSGASLTWAHHELIKGNRSKVLTGLFYTIILAIIFTFFQFIEYVYATFDITDGVYGSTFFMATGFHGFHVVIGTIFLSVCYLRTHFSHFTKEHHFGFEAASWYWHFVDVVWIFLYVTIYVWSNINY